MSIYSIENMYTTISSQLPLKRSCKPPIRKTEKFRKCSRSFYSLIQEDKISKIQNELMMEMKIIRIRNKFDVISFRK